MAFAVAGWFRPSDSQSAGELDAEPAYSSSDTDTDTDTDGAIAAVCNAYDLVDKATMVAGGETSDDPGVDFTIAVNIRTTASLGAAFYFRVLKENPATPQTLADPVRQLASTYQELVLLQTGQAPKEQLDTRYDQINKLDGQIVQVCR
ncbi:Conserved membrane protein of uncharacterised function, alanine and proline rich protein [Mycolicibacterium tokaiense]|uniref:Conserved membrane protein of uncharacterized function, alanine and proline rich protein n=2 Tax=Mycolicibacterium tokaiense TaxID=39695 RepID=A0A378THW2_9MYCO|nr:Conserved membrane protein of uncharacterised function, alanine and proline rich protein [Mycolicibacterium tokaiense]